MRGRGIFALASLDRAARATAAPSRGRKRDRTAAPGPADQRRDQQAREVEIVERLYREGHRGEQVLHRQRLRAGCSRSIPATGTLPQKRRATMSDASSPRLRTRIRISPGCQRPLGRSEDRRLVDPSPHLLGKPVGILPSVAHRASLPRLRHRPHRRQGERLPQLHRGRGGPNGARHVAAGVRGNFMAPKPRSRITASTVSSTGCAER